MDYVWLFLFVEASWLAVVTAAAAREAHVARSEGREPGGVSILGYVTAPPVMFTAMAWGADRARPTLGLFVVAGTHALLAIVALAYTVRTRLALRAGR